MNQEISSFLKAALECSVYICPRDPGLTAQELFEIGKRARYLDGEINDALRSIVTLYFGHNPQKHLPSDSEVSFWAGFFPEEPEFKNFDALDFAIEQLNVLTRAEGAGRAIIERNVLVERAVAKGISRHDIEVAVTWLVLAKQLNEKENVLQFTHPGVRPLPSTTRNNHRFPVRKSELARAHPIVKDVIERRTDGRPRHIEPFEAFGDEIEKLGYQPFRLWWTQMVSELRQSDPNATPVAVSVLAAALVEGALTFIVKHARKVGQFQSGDYAGEARTWKIEQLVASAASGGPSAVLSSQVKARADALLKTRQRIHAGRMLSEYSGGLPDLRPDEARDAKGTAEQVIRAILDWLQKNPVQS